MVSGSWYHDELLLPPYVSIQLPTVSASNGFFEGYSLLFALETASLIKISHHELLPENAGMGMAAVTAESLCSEAELQQLQPRRSGDRARN